MLIKRWCFKNKVHFITTVITHSLTQLAHELHLVSLKSSHWSKSLEECWMHPSTLHTTNADYTSISSEQSKCFTPSHFIFPKYNSELYTSIYVHLKQPGSHNTEGFTISSPSSFRINVHESIPISFHTWKHQQTLLTF